MALFKYRFFLIIFCFFGLVFSETKESFNHQLVSSGLLDNEVQVSYYLNDLEIGFVSYTKMPVFDFYIIHTFYIYPEFRNRGYGSHLFGYCVNHLKSINASRVYVQPGPFEIEGDVVEFVCDASREVGIQKLVKLYRSHGFDFVGKAVSCFARIVYKVVGIDEESDYLMMKKIFH